MRRRYPVTIQSFVPGPRSDFGSSVDVVNDITTIGGTIRDLSLEERESLTLQINQDAHALILPYTPDIGAIRPSTHRVVFSELAYEVIRINRRNFENRTVEIIIGRNA